MRSGVLTLVEICEMGNLRWRLRALAARDCAGLRQIGARRLHVGRAGEQLGVRRVRDDVGNLQRAAQQLGLRTYYCTRP